jgi:hypothetical protein
MLSEGWCGVVVFEFLKYDVLMGTNAIYLVPVNHLGSAAEYAKRGREVLRELGVTSDWVGERGEFGNGPRSQKAFARVEYDDEDEEEDEDEELEDEELPFDDGVIFQGPHFTLVSEEYVDGALCPGCGADVTKEWGEGVTNEKGESGMHDVRAARVNCPKCKGVWRLEECKSDVDAKFFVTDRYVCFYDARQPKAEFLAEFDRRMGCRHEVMEYGWT